jgi:hypothetical protein
MSFAVVCSRSPAWQVKTGKHSPFLSREIIMVVSIKDIQATQLIHSVSGKTSEFDALLIQNYTEIQDNHESL